MKILVVLSVIVLFASSLAAQEEEEAPIELEEIITIWYARARAESA